MAVEILNYRSSLSRLWPRELYIMRQARILDYARRNRWPHRTRQWAQYAVRKQAWADQRARGKPVTWVMSWDRQLYGLLHRYPPDQIARVMQVQAAARRS